MADDIDFEDWDDSDLNFDDFNGGVDEPENDRSPVTQLPNAFVDGVVSKSTDTRFLGNVIKESLPSGYKAGLDKADSLAKEVTTVYKETADQLRPAMNEFKKSAKQHLPKLEKVLPESVSKKLDEFLTVKEDSSLKSQQAMRDEQVGMELGKIFAVQSEQQDQQRQEQALQNVVTEERTKTRHEAMMSQGGQTADALKRLVSYQDNVLSQYQRKHLDLTFRQYFATTDLLEVTRAGQTDIITSLKSIAKNTGLPEVVKQQTNEQYMQLSRDRLLGKLNESIADRLSGVTKNLGKNIRARVQEKAGEFAEGLSMGGEMLDQVAMVDEMSEGMGGETSGASMGVDLVGSLAGGAAAEGFFKRAGRRLSGFLNQNEQVSDSSNMVMNRVMNINEDVNAFARGEGRPSFLNNKFGDFLQEMATSASGENNTVLQNLREQGTESVSFDIMTRRSIVEIIPGFLARILQQVTIANTGDHRTELLTFNKDREEFTTQSQAAEDLKQSIFSDQEKESLADAIADVVDKIDTKSVLSDEARRLFGITLLKDRDDLRKFDPMRYISAEAFPHDANVSVVEEIIAFIKDRYQIVEEHTDEEGNTVEASRGKGSLYSGRLLNDDKAMKSLDSSVVNTQDAMNLAIATGDKELLRQAGIINKQEGTTRDIYNYRDEWTSIERNILDRGEERSVQEAAIENPIEQDSPAGMMDRLRNVFSGERTATPVSETNVTVDQTQVVDGLRKLGGKSDTIASKIDQSNKHLAKLLKLREPKEQRGDREPKTASDVLTLLKEINTNVASILSESTQIKERTGIILADPDGKPLIHTGSIGSMAGGVYKGIKGAASTAFSGLTSYYKTVGSVAGKVLGFGGEQASKLLGKVKDGLLKKDEGDIYVGGFKFPKLRMSKLAEGEYRDKVTGKVITSFAELRELKGEIVDRAGNIVLSAEDAARGLTLANGKSLITKGWEWTKEKPLAMLKSYYSGAFNIATAAWNTAKKTASAIERKMNPLVDIYVKGDEDPVMTKQMIEKGMYFDKESGDVILSFKDIKGEVVDGNGDTVLSLDQIKKGLVDVQGNPIEFKSLGTKLLDYAMSGVAFAGKLGKKGMNRLKSLATGAFDRASGLFGRIVEWFEDTTDGMFTMAGKIEVLNVNAGTANLMGSDEQMEMFKSVNVKLGESAETVKQSAETVQAKSETFVERAGREAEALKNAIDRSEGVQKAKQKFSDIKDAAPEVMENLKEDATEFYEETKAQASAKAEELKGRAKVAKDNFMSSEIGQKAKGKLDKVVATVKENIPEGTFQENLDKAVDETKDLTEQASESLRDSAQSIQDMVSDLREGKVSLDTTDLKATMQNISDRATARSNELVETVKTSATDRIDQLKETIGGPIGEMTEAVKERLPKPKKKARAGSYAEQRAEEEEDEKLSMMAKFSAMMSRAYHGKDGDSKAEKKGGGFMDKIADKVGSFKDSLVDKLNGGAKSVLGKGASMAGKGLRAVGGLAATGLGKVGSALGLGKAAGAAGAGLAAVGKGALAIGGHLLGGAARIALGPVGLLGTLAYGGYKLGSYLADGADAEPLEALRFAQYGIDDQNGDHLRAVRRLEDELYDEVEYTEDGKADMPGVDTMEVIEDMADEFGLDPDIPGDKAKLFNWYNSTFRPVFLAHAAAAHKADEDVDLLDVDDEMDDEHKGPFAQAVYKTVRSMPDVRDASPFKETQPTERVEQAYDELVKAHKIPEESKTEAGKAKPKPAPVKEETSEESVAPMVGAVPVVNEIKRDRAVTPKTAAKVVTPTANIGTKQIAASAVTTSAAAAVELMQKERDQEVMESIATPPPTTEPVANTFTNAARTAEVMEETTDDVMDAVAETEILRTSNVQAQQSHLQQTEANSMRNMENILQRSLEVQVSMDMTLRNINESVTVIAESLEDEDDDSWFGGKGDKESRDKRQKEINDAIAKLKQSRSQKQGSVKGPVSMKKTPASALGG